MGQTIAPRHRAVTGLHEIFHKKLLAQALAPLATNYYNDDESFIRHTHSLSTYYLPKQCSHVNTD